MSARGAVASPHFLASLAGLRVLEGGGNALDAAIAVNLTLGVVVPYACGYGGDLLAIVWADGRAHGYVGVGAAPAAATLDRVGAAAASAVMPQRGPLPVTVPGVVDGWFALLGRFGTRSFASLAATALTYARDGFPVTRRGAATFAAAARAYAGEREFTRVYGETGPGRMLRQADLARTIETLAAQGPEAYYRGAIGSAIVGELRARGGLMTMEDLAAHRGEWTEPMRGMFGDLEVLELPPPTQGVAALQMLAIAGASPFGTDDAAREHRLIESAKLGLSDLGSHITDPAFMRVEPASLIASDHIAALRAQIDPARAARPRPWGGARGGTAYLCVADADGMCVSLIQSNWTGFGSGITVPGWGINLHNRGNLFSLDPGDVNVIAPRKRPMHTLIPGLALRDGRPRLVFGSMGGTGQAQTHLQMLARTLEGDGPAEMVAAPRWLVSPFDWTVQVESRFPAAVVDGLRARGHAVEVVAPYDSRMGHAHAIRVTPDGYDAGTDPRTEGAALLLR